MKNCALNLVNRQHNGINEIRANIKCFNQQATASSKNYNRARKLLTGTTYWLYDKATDAFGPSKFVGFKSMSFECYNYWVARAKTRKGKFLGGATRQANENILEKKFTPNQNLSKKLFLWKERLFHADIFKGIDQSKWRFIEIPKKTWY